MEPTTQKISDTQIKIITPVPEQIIPATTKEEILDYPSLRMEKVNLEEILVNRQKDVVKAQQDVADAQQKLDEVNAKIALCEKEGLSSKVDTTPVVVVLA